jgi:hypothetical protein
LQLATLQANQGKCKELLGTAGKLRALMPDSAGPYYYLAQGLLGAGEPISEARGALQQKWDRMGPSDRASIHVWDEATLAILEGDFVAAERRYAELDKMTAADKSDPARFQLAYPRMLLALEGGRFAEATRLAALYLRQRSGWIPDEGNDFSVRAYAVELAAGGIPRSAFDRLRDEWLARNASVPPALRWVDAYARSVRDPQDAADALAAKPEVHPLLSAYTALPSLAGPTGHAYLLAGKIDDAIHFLSQASASCELNGDQEVIFSTWATFDLGRALEVRGDVEGACAAYARALHRWGAATLPSRTAAKALARSHALGCAR